MGEHFPPRNAIPVGDALGVYRNHDALGADLAGRPCDQFRILDGGGVHAHLVGARIEQTTNVFDRAHATANGERNEHLLCHLFDHMQHDVARIRAGSDVEEGQFVCALFVVAPGDFHRVTGILQRHEIDALDHTAGVDVQTGNDALG